jgi:regulatory protein
MRYNSKYLNIEILEKEIINRLYRYCAYQERAISDVIKQLGKHDIDEKLKKKIIEKLIAEGFLNEERYAQTYMLGKLRNNKWGRIKITHGLKEKSIDPNIIHKVIDKIDEKEYVEIINSLIEKKEVSLQKEDTFTKKNKLARYIIYKGFESSVVWDQINSKIEN